MTKKNRRWKKKKALNGLKRLFNELGGRPTAKDINSCAYAESASFYKRHFGSLFTALKLVCPADAINKQRFSNKFLEEDFRRVKTILGHVPTYENMRKHGKTNPNIYLSRYGSWNKFLKHVGVTKKELINRPGYSKSRKIKRKLIANDGHVCYSIGELLIDNFFAEHNIPHEKEVHYPFHRVYNRKCRLKADWKIGNIYVEYLGMLGHFNKNIRNKYARREERKSHILLEKGCDFMFVTPDRLNKNKREILKFLNEGGEQNGNTRNPRWGLSSKKIDG